MNRTISARRVTPGLLVVVLALSMVLVGPGAPPASAWQGPLPVPVTVPATAYPVSTPTAPLASPEEFNRALNKNPMNYVTKPTTSALMKANTAMAVVAGTASVYALSVGPITSLTGGSTSGDLFCDLSTLAFNSDCAIVPAPEYIPNFDVGQPVPPGWDAVPTFQMISGNSALIHSVQSVTVARSSVSWVVDGKMIPGYSWTWQIAGTVQCWDPAAGVPGRRIAADYLKEPVSQEFTVDCGLGQIPWTLVIGFTKSVVDQWHATWFSEPNPERPPEYSSDPERMWETRWECSQGPGGSAQSAIFKESDATWEPIPQASCDAGFVTMYEVTQITNSLFPGEVVYTWTAPPELTEWAGTQPVPKPGEDPEPVILSRVQPNGDPINCFQHPDRCTDWFGDPDKGENYQCSQGHAVLVLEACNLYVPTFEPSIPPTYSDPTGKVPSLPTPTPPEVGTPTAGRECFPSGWGAFNPSEWVYKPITCALQWAFVPKPGVVAETMKGVEISLKGHAPFSVILAIPGIVTQIGDGFDGGCSGMPNFSGIEGLELRLPCEPPQSAAWTAARSLMVILLWTTVSISAWHMVSRSLGGKE